MGFILQTLNRSVCCSFDNAEVYAGGKAEEVMGQAIKVPIILHAQKSLQMRCDVTVMM